jgi:hypothetical protein
MQGNVQAAQKIIAAQLFANLGSSEDDKGETRNTPP